MIPAMKNLNLLQKKWYFIYSQTAKGKYKQNNSTKFETESIKSSIYFSYRRYNCRCKQ